MKRSLEPVIDVDLFASVEIEKIIDLYGGNPPPELMVQSDQNAVEGRRMLQAMLDAEGTRKGDRVTEEQRRAIEADCIRLINLYANMNDAQNWDAVAELYAVDGRFRRPSGGDFVEGREAILASFKARPPRAQRHVIANTVVDLISESEATAFCAILLFQGDVAPEGELPAMSANSPLVGWYKDKIVLTDDGWRFAERVGGLDFRP